MENTSAIQHWNWAVNYREKRRRSSWKGVDVDWDDLLGDGIRNLKVDKEIKSRRDKALNREWDRGWSAAALEKQWEEYFKQNGQLKSMAMTRSGSNVVTEDLIPEFDIDVAMDLFPEEYEEALEREIEKLEQTSQNATGENIDDVDYFEANFTSLPDLEPTEFVLTGQHNVRFGFQTVK